MSRFDEDFVRRSNRVRFKLRANAGEGLRLSVFRSERNVAVQLIDDSKHSTICAVSSLNKEFKSVEQKGSNKDAAYKLGKIMAQKVLELKLQGGFYFDRGGYAYHGRVKALAEGMRDGGLEF